MSTFTAGKRAIAECDRCGFRYKLNELRKLTINGTLVDWKVCGDCWEPDHPQYELGKYPIRDPQAVRDPRPDFAGYEASRASIVPVTGTQVRVMLGSVTVTVS